MKINVSKSIACIVLSCLLIGSAPECMAQSAGRLDKHARKIHHKLAKTRSGSYLHLVLSGDADSYGALGTLSETSFTFIDAENNNTSTYSYAQVEKIKSDKQRIGQGTEPRRHFRHLVPILIGVAAVGAAGGVYLAVR